MAGILSKPPAKRTPEQRAQFEADRRAKKGGPQKLPGLTEGQNAIINQRQGADYSLGGYAGGQLGNIGQNFSQNFNWDQLPTAPVQGDFNAWRDTQIDAAYQDFNKRFDPQFKQQSEDFEQQMANRGIPVGSELYNQQKGLIQQQQQDARSSAMVQAQNMAGQNAQQFFDIGNQARGNAINEGMQQRYMPLNDFNALYAAQSGMAGQNLGYSQQGSLQRQAEQNQRYLLAHTPHGGGGGGGGGGGNALWQQYGFSSPQEYDAYKTAQARDQQQWQWDNAPSGPKGPSSGAIIGGQIAGIGAGLLGSYVGSLF